MAYGEFVKKEIKIGIISFSLSCIYAADFKFQEIGQKINPGIQSMHLRFTLKIWI